MKRILQAIRDLVRSKRQLRFQVLQARALAEALEVDRDRYVQTAERLRRDIHAQDAAIERTSQAKYQVEREAESLRARVAQLQAVINTSCKPVSEMSESSKKAAQTIARN